MRGENKEKCSISLYNSIKNNLNKENERKIIGSQISRHKKLLLIQKERTLNNQLYNIQIFSIRRNHNSLNKVEELKFMQKIWFHKSSF